MNLSISIEELQNLKLKDKVTLTCKLCEASFQADKAKILRALNPNHNTTAEFCSRSCAVSSKNPKVTVNCNQCGTSFLKKPSEIKKSKNNFCSSSCSAKYTNVHSPRKIRRSKAEFYLLNLLQTDFPNLTILENDRTILPSRLELDLYLPEVSLAIELNGVVHYYPIYGEDKFSKIIKNDTIKQKECMNLKINLISINISQCKTTKATNNLLNSVYETTLKPLTTKLLS